MKGIEFQKRLAGAIKNLEVYTDNFAIDIELVDQLMQEMSQHICPHHTENENKQENTTRSTTTGEKTDNNFPSQEQELQAANSLPDYLQEVYVLYISGYKYHEIANMLHIPTGTVKSRFYAAEKSLERFLVF